MVDLHGSKYDFKSLKCSVPHKLYASCRHLTFSNKQQDPGPGSGSAFHQAKPSRFASSASSEKKKKLTKRSISPLQWRVFSGSDRQRPLRWRWPWRTRLRQIWPSRISPTAPLRISETSPDPDPDPPSLSLWLEIPSFFLFDILVRIGFIFVFFFFSNPSLFRNRNLLHFLKLFKGNSSIGIVYFAICLVLFEFLWWNGIWMLHFKGECGAPLLDITCSYHIFH